jgi:poly(U)-specific endoribonuclease
MWEGDDNGFYARLETDTSTPEYEKYIRINNKNHNPKDQLLDLVGVTVQEVQALPTYQTVAKLFDNYHLNDGHEKGTVKLDEIEKFLNAIIDTNVLRMAQTYIANKFDQSLQDNAVWKKQLKELLFHGAPDIKQQSLFEHVFVGDPDGKKLGGHHFWYKFYLEDKGLLRVNDKPINRDEITVNHLIKAKREVVTLQYSLEPNPDQDLFKKTGGWFVGLSPEGLVAFGIVAFYGSKKKSRTLPIQVDGVNIKLQLYAPGQHGNLFRTFYPMI